MSIQATAEAALALRETVAIDSHRWPEKVAQASLATASHLRGVAKLLPASPIVIWEADMYELAIRGHEEFRGLQNSTVWHPTQPEFWYYDKFTIDVKLLGGPIGESIVDDAEAIAGLFIPANYAGDNIGLYCFVMHPTAGTWYWRFLRLDTTHTASVAQILAAHAFTQQKIAAKESVALPRGERRRLKRLGRPEPEVRVIQLRQREGGQGASAGREYHHRWITSGHWRRLAQPRKSDGAEITFVCAHVKGPAGAPLLQPRESVYVVAR